VQVRVGQFIPMLVREFSRPGRLRPQGRHQAVKAILLGEELGELGRQVGVADKQLLAVGRLPGV
jgi:hypothetical protein